MEGIWGSDKLKIMAFILTLKALKEFDCKVFWSLNCVQKINISK